MPPLRLLENSSSALRLNIMLRTETLMESQPEVTRVGTAVEARGAVGPCGWDALPAP